MYRASSRGENPGRERDKSWSCPGFRWRSIRATFAIIKARREKSMDRLKGKTALVAGAGSVGPGWGNGKATAVTFAREGAQVFCVDRNTAAAEESVKMIAAEAGNAT